MTEQNRIEIAEDFLSKLGALDIDAACEHMAEDAVLMFPYLDGLGPFKGKEQIVDQFKKTLLEFWDRMDWIYDEWYPGADPDILVGELRSKAIKKGGTGTYENDYVTVFRFKGDKIALLKEYLNPAKLNVDIPE